MFDSKLDDSVKQSMMYDSMYGSGRLQGGGGTGVNVAFGDSMMESLKLNRPGKSKFKESSHRRSWEAD